MSSREDNNRELRLIAPHLANIEQKEAYSVPKGYFDYLPGQVMNKIVADPLLKEASSVNPFAVPEHYFGVLPLAIDDRIQLAKTGKFNPAALMAGLLRPKFSVTVFIAGLALFFCILFFEKPVALHPAAPVTEMVYVTDQDVLSVVDESTLMAELSNHEPANKKMKSSTDKQLEDYIINNNIDIADLTKEL